MDRLFFLCKKCGTLARLAHDGGASLTCCGEVMAEAIPNTVDASKEKHLPAVAKEGNVIRVTVGSTAHPMGEAHRILLIYLLTKSGGVLKQLAVDAAPQATFFIADGDKPLAVYAHCNLHGLWMTEL